MKSQLQIVKEKALEIRRNRLPGDIRSYDVDQLDDICMHILKKYPIHYGFKVILEELKSESRERRINMARYSVMWIAHFGHDMPLSLIGMFFGNRDHSTITRACQRLEDWYETEDKFRNYFDEVLKITVEI